MKRSRDDEHSFPSNRGGLGTDITNHGGPGGAKTRRTRNANGDTRIPMRKSGPQECAPEHPGGKGNALKAYVVKRSVVFCSASKARCVQCATRLKYMKKTNDCALLVIDHPWIGRILVRHIYPGRLNTSTTPRSVVRPCPMKCWRDIGPRPIACARGATASRKS